MRTAIAAFLGIWLASTVPSLAQDAKNEGSTQSWKIPSDEQIRSILANRVDEQHRSVGIVVGIVDAHGQRIVAYGHLNQGDTRALNGNTVFEIGSITKVFTTLLLSDMVLRGQVALDDAAVKFLPPGVSVPERAGKQIALVDLATHTSGLPRLPNNMKPSDQANPYADYTVDQLYQFLRSYTLTRDIGSRYEYSNLGVGFLGHLLTLRSGLTYETLLRQQITGPLRMRDTAIALSPDMSARLAIGHDAAMNPVKNWDNPTFPGAGDLRSTANDLLKLLSAELGFTRSPLKSAMAEQLSVRRPTGVASVNVALGWHVFSDSYGTEIEHNGGTGGYHSFIGFDPKALVGVVALSNAETPESTDDIGRYILLGRPLAKPYEAAADAVGNVNMSGSWQVQARYDNGSFATPLCVFQQAGTRLSGTCLGPNSIGTATGSVLGQRVVFQWAASAYTPTGGNGTVSFAGTIDAEKGLIGTTELSGTQGTFTAIRR